jgi:hypothetical protein
VHLKCGIRLQSFETAIIELLPRELGGGSIDRDVSGRRVGAAGRGHHGGSVGHAGIPSTVSDLNKNRTAAAFRPRRRGDRMM